MFLLRCGAVAVILAGLTVAPAAAQIVYQNDFETNTNGFSSSSTISRPTTNAGFASAPQSTYLGRFGNDSVILSLAGLTPGTSYSVAFDLFIEATMDGGEPWSLTSLSSGVLVNTSFSNFFTQAYSDTTFTSLTPQDKAKFTGADVVGPTNVPDTERYSIYYFGRGAGNPVLSFTAAATTETLTFAGSGMQGIADESWSLDNVVVQGTGVPNAVIPEPGTCALLASGLLPLAGMVARRRKA